MQATSSCTISTRVYSVGGDRPLVLPQAQAAEFRRAMFFLCTLALMGTEDQLMQAKSKPEVWARLGFWGRLELRVSHLPTLFHDKSCLRSSKRPTVGGVLLC